MTVKNIGANLNPRERINAIIYIINLDGALGRKRSVERELVGTTIPFRFVSAIEKSRIHTLEHEVDNRYKRTLVPAEIACYLSHLKVKEIFLKSRYDFAIIVEDDIQLSQDFDEMVKKAISQHSSLPKKSKWDVLKLSPHGRKRLLGIKEIDKGYSLHGGSVAITTLAAIWTKRGAELFLHKKAIDSGCPIIDMPIDCALQKPWKYGLKIYNIVPEVVTAKEFGSQIRPNYRLKSDLFKNVDYEIRKLLPRLYAYLKTWIFR